MSRKKFGLIITGSLYLVVGYFLRFEAMLGAGGVLFTLGLFDES